MQMLEGLCRQIVRPERHQYRMSELGPRTFMNQNYRVERFDFQLMIDQQRLQASIYFPRGTSHNVCVVYAHSNSGSRLEGGNIKDAVTAEGIAFCIFDFRGSGLSDGEFVTYGCREKEDLAEVLRYLAQQYNFESYILWGRSMGAATSIIHCGSVFREKIILTIADSSYNNFVQLLQDIGNRKMSIPCFLLKPILFLCESKIIEVAGFNIAGIRIGDFASRCRSPIIFVASKKDTIVPVTHSQGLYKSCQAPHKQLVYIEQDHQLNRGREEISRMMEAINKAIRRDKLASTPSLKQSMLMSKRSVVGLQMGQLPRCSSTQSIQESEGETQAPNSRREHYKLRVLGKKFPGNI